MVHIFSKKKLSVVGNSLGFVIEKPILELLHMDRETEFEMITDGNRSDPYAFHIVENQPFIDRNKRTGLAAAVAFLEFNGIDLDDPSGELYQSMLDISVRKLDKSGFARLLQKLVGQ